VKGEGARAIGLVVAAVIVLASGIWLTRSGRPYGGLLLNVHKLVDLAAVVVIGIAVYQANRVAPLSPAEWLVIVGAALFVVASFASGGVISGVQSPPVAVLWLHRVGSWVAAALAAASACLLVVR
jgi:hypothetical protein